MKTFVTGVILAGLFAAAGYSQSPQQSASAGPSGAEVPSIAAAIKTKNVKVVGAVHHIDLGNVTFLNE